MPRASKSWLSFRGIESTTVGAWIVSAPVFSQGPWRGESKTVIGRSGDVWVSDGAYDTQEIKVKLRFRESRIDDVLAWLGGSGKLVLSWARNRAYDARIEKKLDYKFFINGLNPIIEVDVTFVCQPFRYLWPEAPSFEILSSGSTFANPGTAPAAPRFIITGSGTFAVTINDETLAFDGVTDGGIIVDSHFMDAYSYDGSSIANDKMSGTPWIIQPGVNEISWAATGSGNSVTKIAILPRWRYY